MIAAVLNEAGIRTGMYTSPHLIDYPERLQLCGANISRPAFAEVIEQTKAMADAMIADGLESPTEFEVLTAAAFLWFARERAEIVVVEVGLGGLLDSTNVILPELAVITNVTLEHTDRCGDTVEEIAHHKAGIIKPGVPVVTGAAGAALAVIETAARQHGSVCEVLGREFTVTGSQIEQARQVFELRVGQTPPEFYSNGRGLAGEHQLQYIAGYYGDKAEELLHAVWAYGGEQIKKGVPCKPGLKELLSYLEDLGMPRIVASSSPRTMIELNLQTTGTARYFHDIVCGNEVKPCKPAPDIFLEAARRLQVEPGACQVFEDADSGLEAARRAGMLATDVRPFLAGSAPISTFKTRFPT